MTKVNRIVIVLEITDEETVEEYADVHSDIIFDDLLHGNLCRECGLVKVVKVLDSAKGPTL